MQTTTPKTDAFGNPVDPVVGFARGTIIKSSTEEALRLKNGQKVAAERVRRLGPESIGIFTGNQRDFPIKVEDLNTNCEEWVGPGLYAEELRQIGIRHMGGRPDDGVAVFNRSSAGIIAVIAALSVGRPVVSVVPPRGRSHASVIRGSAIAGVTLTEVQGDLDWKAPIVDHKPALVIITTVTSSLEFLDDATAMKVAEFAKAQGATVFLDEAYGARMRPVLKGGVLSLALGGDLSITNCDKAGLSGPRSGVLVGRAVLVTRALGKGSEFGMEARAPIAASAFRSLERYSPADLQEESASGISLGKACQTKLGSEIVEVSDLGPMIDENVAFHEVFRRANLEVGKTRLVPCEITSAVGLVLLRDFGILTVNTHGQPGARVSIRLKPTHGAIARVGGVERVVNALDAALGHVAERVGNPDAIAKLILG